jgi:hypothetical protein
MAKNTEKIDNLYLSFVRDMLLLLDESKSHYNEKIKKIEKVNSKYTSDKVFKGAKKLNIKDINEEDLLRFRLLKKEQQELYRGIWISMNSNFIYCFALFETFLSGVVKATFKKGGKPRKNYKLKFQQFAIDVQNKEKTDKYVRMLIDDKAMIEHYDDLPNPMKTCMFMLDIDTTKISQYEKYDLQFVESKERRNMLIHRGVYADKRYFDSVERLFSNRKKKVKKFLDTTLEIFSTESKQDKEDRKINLSVSSLYMDRSVATLLYMASLIYFHSFKITKKSIGNGDGAILPKNALHDMMMKSVNQHHHFSFIFMAVMHIVTSYKSTLGKGSWKNVPDFDKINYLLAKDYIIGLNPTEGGLQEREKEKIEKFNIDIISLLSNKNKLFGELLDSNLNNNVDQLINCFNKLDLTKYDVETWFVFNKFRKDKTFQKFTNSLQGP